MNGQDNENLNEQKPEKNAPAENQEISKASIILAGISFFLFLISILLCFGEYELMAPFLFLPAFVLAIISCVKAHNKIFSAVVIGILIVFVFVATVWMFEKTASCGNSFSNGCQSGCDVCRNMPG